MPGSLPFQAILHRNGRGRRWKRLHPFMGLLTCAKCGCSITAEMEKGKYVYYHCTNFRGECDNTYIRQEALADRLADVIKPIQISSEVADDIAKAIRSSGQDAERSRTEALRQLDQRRRAITSKLDRGYEDLLDGRISDDFWARKSKAWEAELAVVDGERARFEMPQPDSMVTAERIPELAKQAENFYESQDPAEQRRLLETVLSNCTFDSGSLCPTYSKPFDLLVRGNETGEWRRGWDSSTFAATTLALCASGGQSPLRRISFVSGSQPSRGLPAVAHALVGNPPPRAWSPQRARFATMPRRRFAVRG